MCMPVCMRACICSHIRSECGEGMHFMYVYIPGSVSLVHNLVFPSVCQPLWKSFVKTELWSIYKNSSRKWTLIIQDWMGESLTDRDVRRLVGEVSVRVPSREVRSHTHRRVCPVQGGRGGERAQGISKCYVLCREEMRRMFRDGK